MSRQSKNRKNRERAKEYTRLHLSGQKGPKATIPVHGKSSGNRVYSTRRRGLKDRSLEKRDTRSTSQNASTSEGGDE